MKEIAFSAIKDLKAAPKDVNEAKLFQVAEEMLDADRIFIAGSGASNEIAWVFAMR
jgi:DNA-binding MurR/RpiR family transcriptional regulator